MGKRGNGEGSIYRRKDGRRVGQYLVHTAKGPKYRYIYGKTRQAVAEKLTKALVDLDGGLVLRVKKRPFGEDGENKEGLPRDLPSGQGSPEGYPDRDAEGYADITCNLGAKGHAANNPIPSTAPQERLFPRR